MHDVVNDESHEGSSFREGNKLEERTPKYKLKGSNVEGTIEGDGDEPCGAERLAMQAP